jgi:hypothetical protein
MEPLDRDGAREARGPEEPPQVHGRHAADGDLVEHDVPSNALDPLALHARNIPGTDAHCRAR